MAHEKQETTTKLAEVANTETLTTSLSGRRKATVAPHGKTPPKPCVDRCYLVRLDLCPSGTTAFAEPNVALHRDTAMLPGLVDEIVDMMQSEGTASATAILRNIGEQGRIDKASLIPTRVHSAMSANPPVKAGDNMKLVSDKSAGSVSAHQQPPMSRFPMGKLKNVRKAFFKCLHKQS